CCGSVGLVGRSFHKSFLGLITPVKCDEPIEEAYFVHCVRTFSLDRMDEVVKFMRATRGA
ncbi:type III PLP-dependent enzyme, partial [Sphingomonas koreensis]